MDRQIKKPWEIPYKIKTHIGSFTLDQILGNNEEFSSELFKTHKFHRLNSEMEKIFYRGAMRIRKEYAGDATKIWKDKPSGAAVVFKFLQFDGCGIKIATMPVNILVRQY